MGKFLSKCITNCTFIPDAIRLRLLENKKYVFPFKTYKTFVQQVIDGDTFHITFFVKSTPMTMKLRLYGVDAPELHTKNPLEKEAAILIKNYLKEKLEGKYFNCELMKWDKYGGRVVGKLFLGKECLSAYLLKHGVVKSYEGAKKENWTDEELNNIIKLKYTDI